ncbi:DUF2514 family protein [Pseudomonas sp. Ps21-P2]|uniref:DUF2514 family protein n=1 Tax=Pseudomonas sp. Ps21-P2 TaxID=3080331 RepID=UPI00320A2304
MHRDEILFGTVGAHEDTAGDPDAAERGKTAFCAAMVLHDRFPRADKIAGELSTAYDAALIAGLACEGAYQSLGSN